MKTECSGLNRSRTIPAIVRPPQKAKAEQIVKAVRGVKSVDNQIVVVGD
jgi:hypothetical protein